MRWPAHRPCHQPSAISHDRGPRGGALRPCARPAHDIPNDVTVQALRQAGRAAPAASRPRPAPGDARHGLPEAARHDERGPARPGARRGDPARRRDALDLGLPRPLRERRRASRAAGRVGARRAAVRQVVRFVRRGDRPPDRAPDCRSRPSSSGARGCSTCSSSTRFSSDQSRFSIQPRLARLGIRTLTVLRFLPPGGGVRAFEFLGDPGLVQLDPRWHQAALQFVRLGFAHILDGTDHLLFLVVPRDSVPPLPLAGRRCHRVHRGALDHADRVGVQPRARRAVVSAARRDADRHVDRLHGAGEHRLHGSEETAENAKTAEQFISADSAVSAVPSGTSLEAPLACDVRLRPRRTASAFRSRCGQTLQFAGSHPADVAAVVQRRRRAGAAAGARAADPGARPAVPLS